MRILALDTATAATTAAVVDTATGLAVEARDDPPPGARPNHARAALRLVEEVLQQASGGWAGIDRIAVGLGPGTFVGLRIGVATAQGLARSQAKPLVGISTLASLGLAATHALGPGQIALAVIDARRGEAFAAAYRAPGAATPEDEDGIAIVSHLQPTVLTPEALAVQASRAGASVAIGDGALKFRDLLVSAGAEVPEDGSPLHRVSALWHCRLAETAQPQPLSAIQPQYLRVPDAELNR